MINESQATRHRDETETLLGPATGFVESTGVGSLINESQAIRDQAEFDAEFDGLEAFVASSGVGSLINESQAIRDKAEFDAEFDGLEGFVASSGVGSLINESQAIADNPLPIMTVEVLRNREVLDAASGDDGEFGEDDALNIIARDWHIAFNVEGDGIDRNDLAAIVLDTDGIYSDEQRAAAAFYLANSEAFDKLESNHRQYPEHDGAVGIENIQYAGGRIGPNREQIIADGEASLNKLKDQGVITATEYGQYVTYLDLLLDFTPAKFGVVQDTFIVANQSIVVTGQINNEEDIDAAVETVFDTAVPLILKQVVLRGLSVSNPVAFATALALAFIPFDTSESRLPPTAGHVPAPVGPGGSSFEGGSVFDDNKNVNNAGVPG